MELGLSGILQLQKRSEDGELGARFCYTDWTECFLFNELDSLGTKIFGCEPQSSIPSFFFFSKFHLKIIFIFKARQSTSEVTVTILTIDGHL